mmetsp:Transcript_15477/g.22460  ORF Transcript_15477/g.22460 Transcript_15477/m.22460 type:complete len:481 (+) Transcript_15477:1590-3032(+)
METKMKVVPFTLALIKPDTAASQEKVEAILEKTQNAGLEIYQKETRVLDKEDVINLYAKLKGEDFFQELLDYMMSGPVQILLLTMNEGDPIETWRNLIGPREPSEAKLKAPESLRAVYGTSVVKNELHGSLTSYQAAREIDIFDFPTPLREPDFEFDKYKLSLETIQKFLFPPHLEHPDVSGRLDVLALYGPIVNYHSVDQNCFCLKCSRSARQKIKGLQVSISKQRTKEGNRRLVNEQEIIDIWEELCEDCKLHCENYSHLTGGNGAQHLMTDIEIKNLIDEFNRNELEEILRKIKGTAAKTIMLTIDFEYPKELYYTATQVTSLLGNLEKDYYGRMDFYEVQKVIMNDRKIRINFWLSKIIGKPVESMPTLFEDPESGRSLPLTISEVKKIPPKSSTRYDKSIADAPKLGPNAEKVALFKRLHRDAFQIAEGKALNSVSTANNVRLLREYAPGRHGLWDNYVASKHPGANTHIYKRKL